MKNFKDYEFITTWDDGKDLYSFFKEHYPLVDIDLKKVHPAENKEKDLAQITFYSQPE